jgi:Amino acid permease
VSAPAKSVVRKASLFYFVFVMYSYTTGGPFGLEDQVTTSGPGMTLLYHLVLPLFWCIPVSLVSAELTTAMPVEGGFYRWTRAAFGDLWGFLAGWWNWTASFLLGASYAVLFTDYLGFYFPQLTGWKHYLVALCVIALVTWLNVRGIQMVGKAATTMEIFILIPILVMIVMGLAQWKHNPFVPMVPPNQPFEKVFGVGLALGLWLYSGYEQLSTVAEEVENPQRSYPLALALVVPLSIATYFLPTFAGLAALGNWQQWKTGYFSDAAALIGGHWLDDARRHDHEPRIAEQHGPNHDAHAVRDGRRRIPSAVPRAQASEVRHALGGHCRLGRNLRRTRPAYARTTDQHLHLATRRDHSPHGARGVGHAQEVSRPAARVSRTGRQRRIVGGDHPAPPHDAGDAALQRSIRAEVRGGRAGAGPGRLCRTAAIPEEGRDATERYKFEDMIFPKMEIIAFICDMSALPSSDDL